MHIKHIYLAALCAGVLIAAAIVFSASAVSAKDVAAEKAIRQVVNDEMGKLAAHIQTTDQQAAAEKAAVDKQLAAAIKPADVARLIAQLAGLQRPVRSFPGWKIVPRPSPARARRVRQGSNNRQREAGDGERMAQRPDSAARRSADARRRRAHLAAKAGRWQEVRCRPYGLPIRLAGHRSAKAIAGPTCRSCGESNEGGRILGARPAQCGCTTYSLGPAGLRANLLLNHGEE